MMRTSWRFHGDYKDLYRPGDMVLYRAGPPPYDRLLSRIVRWDPHYGWWNVECLLPEGILAGSSALSRDLERHAPTDNEALAWMEAYLAR